MQNQRTLRRANPGDRLPLARMLELYQHDLSDIWDQDLDAHGEYGYALDKYFQQTTCSAWLILVADKFAGFALVNDCVSLPENQLWMAQFFVLKKYRKQGTGRWAALQLFDQLRGRWEIGQMPGNDRATRFWRGVIADYCGGQFVEYHLDDERWHGYLQCFDNSGPDTHGTI